MEQQKNRIAVVTMVRDEADIIESFVRHHLAMADVMYVIDHASVDGTSEILAKLASEGLPLAVMRYDGVAQLQAELMTQGMAQAFADGATLVLPLDADEFVWPEDGRTLAEVRRELQALPAGRVYRWAQWNCRPVPSGSDDNALLSARPAERAAQPTHLGKVFVGRAAYQETRAQHGRLLQGNHQFVIDGAQGPARIVPEAVTGLFLAHFPWRSAEQAGSKEAVGWVANVAKYTHLTTRAHQWHDGFARVLAGAPVQDPMEGMATLPLSRLPEMRGVRQRYRALAHVDLLRSVLLAAQGLAEAYRESEVLRLGRRVSIVLPYLGDAQAFQTSLASILAEGYPHRELLVLPLADDAFSTDLPAFLAAQETEAPMAILEGSDATARFSDLRQTATGDYVQWVMPGRVLAQGRLLPMVASLESDATMTFLTSDIKEPGKIELPLTEPFQQAGGDDIASALRAERKTLAGGITAPLFRRRTMDACAWAAPFFHGAAFDEARFWQAVLPGAVVGVGPATSSMKGIRD